MCGHVYIVTGMDVFWEIAERYTMSFVSGAQRNVLFDGSIPDTIL